MNGVMESEPLVRIVQCSQVRNSSVRLALTGERGYRNATQCQYQSHQPPVYSGNLERAKYPEIPTEIPSYRRPRTRVYNGRNLGSVMGIPSGQFTYPGGL